MMALVKLGEAAVLLLHGKIELPLILLCPLSMLSMSVRLLRKAYDVPK